MAGLRQIGDEPAKQHCVSAALATLRALVPAEYASYNEIDGGGARTLVEPRGADDFPGGDEAFARHFRQHPFIVHLGRISDGRVWLLSELVSRRQFHRLGIYGEYHRRLEIRLADRAGVRVLVLRERRAGLRRDLLRRVGLTRREAQILALVAEGHGNTEIGHALGASPRTVGKHLEAVYRKLDVSGRTAAAAWLQRLEEEWTPDG